MPAVRTKKQRWYETDAAMAAFGVFGWVGIPTLMSLIYMAIK